jgi:hypothetical protein
LKDQFTILRIGDEAIFEDQNVYHGSDFGLDDPESAVIFDDRWVTWACEVVISFKLTVDMAAGRC